MVGTGKAMVVEPDPDNLAALQEFIERHGLESRIVLVPAGAWSEKTELTFLSSPLHPASNAVEQVNYSDDEAREKRHYERISVPVDTIDAMLAEAGLEKPKLVSITTNGSDFEILDGMDRTIAGGCPYISLAAITDESMATMERLNYEHIAKDDRGHCYRQRK